ncbi:MAG TPA: condensation domain-containing protein, partial [Candidatus Deferrimicrobium sp.]|nr:condensation domain-containing protein [Candidatus Deferrimicrobium sp.]
GIPGELCISGAGLAEGYLNNPELTAEKFIEFHQPSFIIHHSILYRTGDLTRWLPDGNIEFLGRIDQQVKIRGFRIELGEIENRLAKHPGIKESVLSVHEEESGDNYLCAYIVPARELGVPELREYLSGALPTYMIPAYFMFLEKIPLTLHGKIDRKALPQPGRESAGFYVAPVNEIEAKLVEIWSEILHIDKDKISTHENFFNRGGHSLKANTLAFMIHKELKVKIPQAEIFLNPTVRGLANYIGNAVRTRYDSIEPVEKKEYYVLSAGQKRLYILQQLNPLSSAYNMPQIIPLAVGFDAEKLAQTFRRLIRRHESLRTSFQTLDDQPVQKVHEPGEVEFKIEYKNNNTPGHFTRAFDLSKAPLLRVELVRAEAEKHFLIVDMHHIISDGVSHQVLREDFTTLYDENELPPLRIQYKDFAQWQNSQPQVENINRQEAYWLRMFEGKIPQLNLPLDFPRPGTPHFEGEAVSFSLEKQLVGAAEIIASQQGVTMYMMFLALFNVLLARVCGQEDIVIGTASAGRRHADLQRVIGMFVNTLALRNYPQHRKSFSDFLQEIKQRTLAAFENQDYPFENLVDKVVPNRNINRNPLFDIMFNFLELDEAPGKEPVTGHENKREPEHEPEYEHIVNVSKFDMTLTISKTGADDLHFNIRYSTQLFKNETIREFVRVFKEVAAGAIANPTGKIAEIKIATQLKMDNVWDGSAEDLENE